VVTPVLTLPSPCNLLFVCNIQQQPPKQVHPKLWYRNPEKKGKILMRNNP
jgi:hypothetical protein